MKAAPKQNERPTGSMGKKGVKAGLIFTLLILVLYAASLVNMFFNKNIKTDVIQNGVIQESASLNAIFIRNEQVLVSDSEGFYIREIDEGSHVKAFSGIVTILSGEAPSLTAGLSEIDDEILKMKNDTNISEGIYSSDISQLDGEIESKIHKLAIEGNNDSVAGVSTIKDQIEKMLREKASIFATLNAASPQISELMAKRQSLQDQIRANSRTIIVDRPGTVSYFTDSFETALNPSGLTALTSESIAEVLDNSNARSIPYGSLYAGMAYAKLITGNDYYIAASVDATALPDYENGNPVIIRINDIEKTFTAAVEYVSPVADGRRIIVIKTDKYLAETARMRSADVDLINRITSGFKVPLTSLVDVNLTDMTAGIFKSQANIVKRVDLKILGKNDEYAIVDNLYPDGDNPIIGLYSSYVVKPENIEEGMVIK